MKGIRGAGKIVLALLFFIVPAALIYWWTHGGEEQILVALQPELRISEIDRQAANIGLANVKSMKSGAPAFTSFWSVLLQLGFFDEAVKMGPAPDFAPYLWRNDPKGLGAFLVASSESSISRSITGPRSRGSRR